MNKAAHRHTFMDIIVLEEPMNMTQYELILPHIRTYISGVVYQRVATKSPSTNSQQLEIIKFVNISYPKLCKLSHDLIHGFNT